MYADDLLLTGVLGEPTCSKSAVIDEMRCGIAQRGAAQAEGAGFDTQTENEDTKSWRRWGHSRCKYRFVVGGWHGLGDDVGRTSPHQVSARIWLVTLMRDDRLWPAAKF